MPTKTKSKKLSRKYRRLLAASPLVTPVTVPEDAIQGWHFLPRDKVLAHNDLRPVRVGVPLSLPDRCPVILCRQGLHASSSLIDALALVTPHHTWLCRVSVWGDLHLSRNKFAGRTRVAHCMLDAKCLHNTLRLAVLKYLINTQKGSRSPSLRCTIGC